MKGFIIINAFKVPIQNVLQAERLKAEFNSLGVEVDIISDGEARVCIENGQIKTKLVGYDFAIFLDKDKYLSNVLSRSNIRLFNSHDSIRICDDKAETCIELANKGFNIPKTICGMLCYRKEDSVRLDFVNHIAYELKFPVVIKESFGSMGKGVYKADNIKELIEIMERVKLKPHLLQSYIGFKPGVDVRIIVVNKKAVASMQRINENDFRSNIGCGGRGEKVIPPASFIQTAERVATTLDLDYCGVDIIYGENDTPYVCEVNSNAFFEEIEKITSVNVAKLYAQFIVDEINKKTN